MADKNRIQFYKDRRGEWRWRLRYANGKIGAVSGDGYVNFEDAVREYKATRECKEVEYLNKRPQGGKSDENSD